MTQYLIAALYFFVGMMGVFCLIRASVAHIERRRQERRNRTIFKQYKTCFACRGQPHRGCVYCGEEDR